jgi:hypothetical protein
MESQASSVLSAQALATLCNDNRDRIERERKAEYNAEINRIVDGIERIWLGMLNDPAHKSKFVFPYMISIEQVTIPEGGSYTPKWCDLRTAMDTYLAKQSTVGEYEMYIVHRVENTFTIDIRKKSSN